MHSPISVSSTLPDGGTWKKKMAYNKERDPTGRDRSGRLEARRTIISSAVRDTSRAVPPHS